jgi:hypothetical protein
LIYSIDAPVTSLIINHLFDRNQGILSEFGKQMRQETAIAQDAIVAKVLEQQRRTEGIEGGVGNFRMEVEQIETGDSSHPTPIKEAYKVVEDVEHAVNKDRGRRK